MRPLFTEATIRNCRLNQCGIPVISADTHEVAAECYNGYLPDGVKCSDRNPFRLAFKRCMTTVSL